jgi:hypothetical protein
MRSIKLTSAFAIDEQQGDFVKFRPSLVRTRAGAPTRLVAISVTAAALTACGGGDERSTDPIKAAIACGDLAGQTIGNVQVTAAVPVAATGTLPAFCKVNGTEIGTQHDMEVRLPETWTQRFVQQGGGGFDGSIPAIGATNVALSEGAVLSANNGGHRDPSGNVLLNNEPVVQRYAHTAIPTATKFAKAVTVKYYGREPSYSYYQGCSNGGRGALNAAAKYGTEFDAVIAGAPTMNLSGQIEQWTRASKLTVPATAKLAAISAAAIEKCDALDGVRDGIVSNWAACQFDATVDVPASVGLTASEAAAVKSLMTDLKLANGTTIYSAFGTGQLSGFFAFLGVGHMRNVVLHDAAWDPATFDVDTYYPIITAAIDGKYGFSASAGGLADFMRNGKKIIVWHGSDDGLLSHKDTLRTWETVKAAAGAAAANSKVYIAGGVNHCSGGAGADRFDLLKPTMDWVEKGVEPGTITASKVTANVTQFTRPLCVYPAFPKYNGSGDVNSASSFTCSTS